MGSLGYRLPFGLLRSALRFSGLWDLWVVEYGNMGVWDVGLSATETNNLRPFPVRASWKDHFRQRFGLVWFGLVRPTEKTAKNPTNYKRNTMNMISMRFYITLTI